MACVCLKSGGGYYYKVEYEGIFGFYGRNEAYMTDAYGTATDLGPNLF
jgi:hypothetical protein